MTDETELTPEQRATAKLWADRIIADEKAHARGGLKKCPSPWEWVRDHGEDSLMELPTLSGKPLRECNRIDLSISIEAHKIAEQHYSALVNAARLLAAEAVP